MTRKPVIIVGTGNIADIVHYYLVTSWTRVEAFSVSEDCMTEDHYKGLPIVPFENIEKKFSPSEYNMFIAIGYKGLNHLRAKFYYAAKEKGYNLISYVSPKATLDPSVEVGDNVFIFEGNNIQYNASIGDNTILWAGNHIGHETKIGNHVYIASHVVVSGFCNIGDYCFMGVNAAVADEITIGDNCLIAMGANLTHDLAPSKICVPPKSSFIDYDKLSESAREMFKPRYTI